MPGVSTALPCPLLGCLPAQVNIMTIIGHEQVFTTHQLIKLWRCKSCDATWALRHNAHRHGTAEVISGWGWLCTQ